MCVCDVTVSFARTEGVRRRREAEKESRGKQAPFRDFQRATALRVRRYIGNTCVYMCVRVCMHVCLRVIFGNERVQRLHLTAAGRATMSANPKFKISQGVVNVLDAEVRQGEAVYMCVCVCVCVCMCVCACVCV